MITNVSLCTLYVTDQDAAKAFYVDKLGFVERADVRWVTASAGYRGTPEPARAGDHPDAPRPAPRRRDGRRRPARAWTRARWAAIGLHTDDCHKTYEELSANGVEFVQLPSDRPYGVEAILRDNSGNWLVLVQPGEYSPEDFES